MEKQAPNCRVSINLSLARSFDSQQEILDEQLEFDMNILEAIQKRRSVR
jgi:hypothetical protein